MALPRNQVPTWVKIEMSLSFDAPPLLRTDGLPTAVAVRSADSRGADALDTIVNLDLWKASGQLGHLSPVEWMFKTLGSSRSMGWSLTPTGLGLGATLSTLGFFDVRSSFFGRKDLWGNRGAPETVAFRLRPLDADDHRSVASRFP